MSQATVDLVRRELRFAADAPQARAAPGYWKASAQRLLRDPVTIAVTLVLLRHHLHLARRTAGGGVPIRTPAACWRG